MKMRLLLLAGAGALTFGSLSLSANAAPSIGSDLKTAANEASTVEQVTYRNRRCWRRHGHLHCRYRSYGYSPYYDGGYYSYGGPSIGLYFGGGGRHFHGGRHHRR
jgi:hypothetical protein